MKILFLFVVLLIPAGCSVEMEGSGRRGVEGAAPARGETTTPSKRSRRKQTKEDLEIPSEIPDLSERDFVADTESNRDPFRSFLVPEEIDVEQASFEDTRVVLLDRYELTELRLTGIVGGRSRYAMFRAPDNRTTNVSRGVRITKSRALLVEIAEDHVILQIPQLTDEQIPTFVERIVWVDPNRRIIEIGRTPLRADEEGIRYSSGQRSGRFRRRKGAEQ